MAEIQTRDPVFSLIFIKEASKIEHSVLSITAADLGCKRETCSHFGSLAVICFSKYHKG